MHSTRDPGRDLHIPPGILYPTHENIVLLFLFLQTYLWIIHTLRKYLACGQDRGGHCSLRENTPFK